MSIWPTTLMTPLHVHGVRTEADYRALQSQFIARGRQVRPALQWRDPWVCADQPDVFVAGGKWLVACACGNAPSVSPEWRLALCFECGAIYEGVTMPPDAAAIEAVLSRRPHPINRAWRRPETVEDLQRENAAHGV